MSNTEEEKKEINRIFDSQIFIDYLKSKLISLFDTVQGQKLLIADQDILKILSMVLDNEQIKENGIQISTLESIIEGGLSDQINHIVFFIPPKTEILAQLNTVIKNQQQELYSLQNKKKKSINKDFTYIIVFWPQKTILCDEALERLQLKGIVQVKDFNFDLVPLEDDLLSYEMSSSFFDLYLRNDLNMYYYISESIQRLQAVFGQIPNVFAKGDGAKVVLNILQQEKDLQKEVQSRPNSDIESLILIDRSVDLVTPCLYQMVYEAQIDEQYGIEGNICRVQKSVISSDPKDANQQTAFRLNAKFSPLFKDIRSSHINTVSGYLQNQYMEQKKVFSQASSKSGNKTLEELDDLKNKVAKLKQVQPDIERHLGLNQNIFEILNNKKSIQFVREQEIQKQILLQTEEYNYKNILDYIDLQCAIEAPIENVFRLLTLLNQFENGIKAKEYDRIRRSILTAYGFDKLVTLDLFAQCNLIRKGDGSKSIQEKIIRKFNLLDPEVDINNPQDTSYVFGGFSPLIARLVEQILKTNSWKDIKENLNLIPGQSSYPEKYKSLSSNKTAKNAIFLFVIGGITYSEIAAIRYLSQKYGREIIIGTTQILNFKKIYQQIYKGQQENSEIETQSLEMFQLQKQPEGGKDDKKKKKK
ncbi:Sec1-like protein [Pseudocohnilembus persalinus]|uniref:Sec1-like protein n=1 Tax=Pseudocohnilembus persalinus TaxID=266149 RepID=A0A0V0QDH1_PSEPJ|nr:Sec1-like protein [Pseudocohnilembus persalinus]|eukprot:KRX00184.1 Sec1-like protein [Pseudocohnilembus persalinus]